MLIKEAKNLKEDIVILANSQVPSQSFLNVDGG